MLKDVNLNSYKVFYYVAKYNSFKLASEKLYISQPAVSKQIKNLEDTLDIKLFYRYSNGIELTKEGNVLYNEICKMVFYLEASEKYISSSKKLLTGDLTIGCPSHIASFYLLEYIGKFKKDYPNINIKVVSYSTASLVSELNHHKIDFIIDSFPIEVNDNCIIKQLKTFDMIFIKNSNYEADVNKLEEINFILPLARSSTRKTLEQCLIKNNIKINVGLALDTTNLIITAVKRNLGIGYVVKESVIDDIKSGIINEFDLGIQLPKMELNLVYMVDYLSIPARTFLEKYIKVKL